MAWIDRLLGRGPAGESVAGAMEQARLAVERGDHAAALEIWGPLAHSGVARAQNNIGACFAEGFGVARDLDLAVNWLSLAANAGDPVGQRNFAALHFKGEGVPQSDDEARRWYRVAAEAGDAPAQDMLSWMLVEAGDPADLPEARALAEKAAASGIAASMTRLGMMYHDALGVPRDPELSVHWWRRGAEAGDADAEAMLGAACLLGQGVPRDPARALELLTRAEARGSLLAPPFLKAAKAEAAP